MPKLESADTPLEAPLSSDEISWIVAINCIGSLLSSMSYGFIISVIGSKRALMSATVSIKVKKEQSINDILSIINFLLIDHRYF